MYLPLRKISFLDSLQILVEKFLIESVGSKTSSGTHFGSPKGPGTKKEPKEGKLGFGPKFQLMMRIRRKLIVCGIRLRIRPKSIVYLIRKKLLPKCIVNCRFSL